jgi:hypothetical protein
VKTLTRCDPSRIFQRIRVTETECWEYTRGIGSGGYGIVSVNDKAIGAHKLAYLLRRGPVPKGMCVLHECDNRKCINPDHLFLGTKGVNNRDRKQKGRNDDRRGRKNYMVKLTENQVHEIRNLASGSGLSQREIGKRFGICQQQVCEIARRKAWVHL